MSSRRIKSLHHNLKDKNVVFHREHRSKRNRTPNSIAQRALSMAHKKRLEELELQELEQI